MHLASFFAFPPPFFILFRFYLFFFIFLLFSFNSIDLYSLSQGRWIGGLVKVDRYLAILLKDQDAVDKGGGF